MRGRLAQLPAGCVFDPQYHGPAAGAADDSRSEGQSRRPACGHRGCGQATAYQALSCEFYYVMPAGLAALSEIPFDCGVMYAEDARLVVARPAEHRPVMPGFGEWMAIARRGAERFDPPDSQLLLE